MSWLNKGDEHLGLGGNQWKKGEKHDITISPFSSCKAEVEGIGVGGQSIKRHMDK